MSVTCRMYQLVNDRKMRQYNSTTGRPTICREQLGKLTRIFVRVSSVCRPCVVCRLPMMTDDEISKA
jgi:hypothetical protein